VVEGDFSSADFFDLTLREFISPAKPLVCKLAEKKATLPAKEEEVSAAPKTAPLPPPFRGLHAKDNKNR
jgi:hypothetical protein